MAKKTLVDLFGTSAAQNASTVTVDKTALTAQGLTASTSNTAQSIVAGLLKIWAAILTSANRTTNNDETIVVSYDGQTSRTEGTNLYRVDTYRVQLFKLTPPQDADPDDY